MSPEPNNPKVVEKKDIELENFASGIDESSDATPGRMSKWLIIGAVVIILIAVLVYILPHSQSLNNFAIERSLKQLLINETIYGFELTYEQFSDAGIERLEATGEVDFSDLSNIMFKADWTEPLDPQMNSFIVIGGDYYELRSDPDDEENRIWVKDNDELPDVSEDDINNTISVYANCDCLSASFIGEELLNDKLVGKFSLDADIEKLSEYVSGDTELRDSTASELLISSLLLVAFLVDYEQPKSFPMTMWIDKKGNIGKFEFDNDFRTDIFDVDSVKRRRIFSLRLKPLNKSWIDAPTDFITISEYIDLRAIKLNPDLDLPSI